MSYPQPQHPDQEDEQDSFYARHYSSSYYNNPQGSHSDGFIHNEESYNRHQQQQQPPSPYRTDDYRYPEEEAHQYNSHSLYHQQQTSGTPWWFQKLLEWMEFITRPKVAMVATILVIVVLQFHEYILAWIEFYFPPHVSFYESCVALFWQGADWVRGNLQRGVELARNLQPHSRNRIPGFEGSPNHLDLPGSLNRRNDHSHIPELESLEEANVTLLHTNKERPYVGGYRFDDEPLPPAFLNECDYPQGWMVFHPVLGVTSKAEADAFEEQAKRKIAQDQNQDADIENNTSAKKSPSEAPQPDKENLQNKQQQEKPQQQKSLSPPENVDNNNNQTPQPSPAPTSKVHGSSRDSSATAIQQQLTPAPSVVAANG